MSVQAAEPSVGDGAALHRREYVLRPAQSLVIRVVPPPSSVKSASGRAAPPQRGLLSLKVNASLDSTVEQTAEVFGCDLKPEVWHRFTPGKAFSVYTNTGVSISVEAEVATLRALYITSEMSLYVRSLVEIHYALEEMRVAAKKAADASGGMALGPRVLVCGTRGGCGKSSLIRTLANYAVRLRYHPIVVDLDVGNPSSGGYPETVGVTVLQYPVEPVEETSFLPSTSHLFFGATSFSQNMPLFVDLMSTASELVMTRQSRFPRSKIGGLFVDFPTMDAFQIMAASESSTSNIMSGGGDGSHSLTAGGKPCNPIDLLMHALQVFEIDTIVCVGGDWLLHQVQRRCNAKRQRAARRDDDPQKDVVQDSDVGDELMTDDTTSTVRLPNGAPLRCLVVPFGGCDASVPRTAESLPVLRRLHWTSYFFGTATSPLLPTIVELDLSKVRLAVIGAIVTESMQHLMPLKDDDDVGAPLLSRRVQEVTAPDVPLKDRIVAISDACAVRRGADGSYLTDEPLSFDAFYEEVSKCRVAGFALVRYVTSTSISLLVPNSRLPIHPVGATCLLLGETFLKTRQS